jgi:hypothetical protein
MASNCRCPRCGWIEPQTVAGSVQCKHCGEIFQPSDATQAAKPDAEHWWMDRATAPADPATPAANSVGQKWWTEVPLPIAGSAPIVAQGGSPIASTLSAEGNNQGLRAADWVMLGLGAVLIGAGLVGLFVLFPCLVITGNRAAVALLVLGLLGTGLIVGALRQRVAVAAVIGGAVFAILVAGAVFASRSQSRSTAHDGAMPSQSFTAANTSQATRQAVPQVPASRNPLATTSAASPPPATLPLAPAATPASPAAPPVVGKIENEFDVRDAVYLIEVQVNGKLIPFATCCAINETTLLTSAREAAQLVYWRKNGMEQRILVCNEKGVKREVEEIRALRDFTPLLTAELLQKSKKAAAAQDEPVAESKPANWLYFDLALLTVEDKLPAFAPLASSDDLKALEDGLPLRCVGYAHDGKMINKDKLPKLQSGAGSIYLVTTIPPPGPAVVDRAPRLLHLDGEIPTQWVDDPNDATADDTTAKRKVPFRAYGSPLFNRQGKLVAVFADTPPKGEKPMLLHLAPVIDPSLIERWTGGQASHTEDIQSWTLPDVFSPPPKSPGTP